MPLTIGQFSQRLTSSGVMSADDLRDWLSALPNDKRPSDGEQMARELVKQKRLTAHQASTIYSGKGSSLVMGNYVVLDKLGQGGMGVVLKAEHRRMGRLVAIKVMSAAAMKSADAVKRFQREVQAVAKLEHPNIVTAHDADEVNGTHFLVMQYVDGDDLSALVKKSGRMPIDRAVDCILQAARGLEFAHQRGIIHRDIKPHNLLMGPDGVVKILDMGLARIEDPTGAHHEASLTSTGAVMGTIDYMSPEQALDTKTADARSDIYSLGCTLFYLLTGEVPFQADTMMKRLLAHREAPIPSLEGHVSDAPHRCSLSVVETIFRRMVAKKPEERHQSMTEVVADLQSCLNAAVTAPVAVHARSEESDFNAFLNRMSGPGHSGTSVGPTAAPVNDATVVLPQAGASDAATASYQKDEFDTDPTAHESLTQAAPKRRKKAKKKSKRTPYIAAGVVGGLLLLGLVWSLIPPQKPDDSSQVTEAGSSNTGPTSDGGKSGSKVKTTTATKTAGESSANTPASASGGVQDLLSLIDLARDVSRDNKSNDWRRENGTLRTVGGRLYLPVENIPDEYDLRLRVERKSAGNALVIGLVSGQRRVAFVMDGYASRGGMWGLELINGKGPPDNRAYVMQRNMKLDQPVDLLVQVRKSGIRVERDSQLFLDWNGNPSQLSLGPTWDDKGSPRLFLGAQAAFVIHRLEFVPLTKVDSQSQWIDLFNGKDLSGWKEMGVKYWSVTDGVIVGKTASNSGWLMSDRVYGDYELELEYKLSPGSNSGLFLRAWPEGNISGNQFREIQLLDDEAPAFSTLKGDRRTGSIFGMVAPQTTPKVPANQWHRVRVLLQGQQVEVAINGIDVLKHTLNDLPPLGRIGLQLYPTQVEFRNIRVRPLDSATGSR